jgi:predicted HTH transcriptional regulator
LKNKVHYIEGLIKLGENINQDFKFAINDSKKIARSLVAFSNTAGGRLLVGVKDNGTISGVRTDEEYHMVEAAAELYCRPRVNFSTKNWTVQGKRVLEIIIPESDKKPHMAMNEDKKWIAYIRVDDENIAANSVLIKVWQKQKSASGIKIKDTEYGKKLLQFLNENEYISLSSYLKLAKIAYIKAVNILSDYIVLGLLEMNYQKNGFFYRLKQNDINRPE